jgi:hypothetical protein
VRCPERISPYRLFSITWLAGIAALQVEPFYHSRQQAEHSYRTEREQWLWQATSLSSPLVAPKL